MNCQGPDLFNCIVKQVMDQRVAAACLALLADSSDAMFTFTPHIFPQLLHSATQIKETIAAV